MTTTTYEGDLGDLDVLIRCVAEAADMLHRGMCRGVLPLHDTRGVLCRLRCTLAVLRRRAREEDVK